MKAEKDAEIANLKDRIAAFDSKKALVVSEAVSAKVFVTSAQVDPNPENRKMKEKAENFKKYS